MNIHQKAKDLLEKIPQEAISSEDIPYFKALRNHLEAILKSELPESELDESELELCCPFEDPEKFERIAEDPEHSFQITLQFQKTGIGKCFQDFLENNYLDWDVDCGRITIAWSYFQECEIQLCKSLAETFGGW